MLLAAGPTSVSTPAMAVLAAQPLLAVVLAAVLFLKLRRKGVAFTAGALVLAAVLFVLLTGAILWFTERETTTKFMLFPAPIWMLCGAELLAVVANSTAVRWGHVVGGLFTALVPTILFNITFVLIWLS